ncbi:hypothetical protein H4R26_006262, partial [Coemansia thaxteri]
QHADPSMARESSVHYESRLHGNSPEALSLARRHFTLNRFKQAASQPQSQQQMSATQMQGSSAQVPQAQHRSYASGHQQAQPPIHRGQSSYVPPQSHRSYADYRGAPRAQYPAHVNGVDHHDPHWPRDGQRQPVYPSRPGSPSRHNGY